MITLNQLIILYKDIAARHKQVNDFAAVQDFNISTDSTHSYPILVVNPTAANLPRTENGYTSFTTVFDLQVIDLVNKDNDNRMDVLSDTQQILNDVVNEFNTHPYYIDSGIDTINNISFEPLRGVYDGDVDGWKISMELEHPNKLSYCGNPIENLQGFDFSPASVTVFDGLDQFELYPSDTYTCEPFASINVSNSNDTYSEDITTNLELPNINFTDSDGTQTSVPSMEDLICTPAAPKSGIQYNRPTPTGMVASYRVGDDYWQTINNPYNDAPTNPLYCQDLVDFYTLKYDNEFGNKFRFTDQSGALGMANDPTINSDVFTSDTLIDNYSGLEWGVNNLQAGNNKDWNTSIDECLALNVQGFDDWYLPNINELLTVSVFYRSVKYYLLVFTTGSRAWWSSSTAMGGSTNAPFLSGSQLFNSGKTSNRNYYPVRKRF